MDVLAFFGLGTTELIIIGVVGVLVFGRRLPEVGKNLGRSLVQFKRELKGTSDELSEVGQAVDEVKGAVQDAAADVAEHETNHTA